jgi:hypothetical protein
VAGRKRSRHSAQNGERRRAFPTALSNSDIAINGCARYLSLMTDLLEKAVRAARNLPPAAQDDIARVVLALAEEGQEFVELTPEDEASLTESFDQAARREFASEEEVRAVWAKHGL